MEKCNYNPNLVWVNKIQKRFLCVKNKQTYFFFHNRGFYWLFLSSHFWTNYLYMFIYLYMYLFLHNLGFYWLFLQSNFWTNKQTYLFLHEFCWLNKPTKCEWINSTNSIRGNFGDCFSSYSFSITIYFFIKSFCVFSELFERTKWIITEGLRLGKLVTGEKPPGEKLG